MSGRRLGLMMLGALTALALAACATNEHDNSDVATVQQYELPTAATGYKSSGAIMRHNIRELAEYDVSKMVKLVHSEVNMNEESENAYLDQAATTLAQTVFVQPDFNSREISLRELKGLLEPEQYPIVLNRATEQLLYIMKNSPAGSDQASALFALTNVVVEVRALKQPELKTILQKIADANLKVTEAAKKFAASSMERLISPSSEARSALQKM